MADSLKIKLACDSAPVLGTVPNMQDFNNFSGVRIDDHERRTDQFSCACNFARAAEAGEYGQLVDSIQSRARYLLSGGGAVPLNVFDCDFQLVSRTSRPANTPQSWNRPPMRRLTSSCSTSSPRSAWAMPFRTPATKLAWSSSIRLTVSLTICSASLPVANATC